jgi:Domain of unknown function DUF29
MMATGVKARPADLHAADGYLWALSQAEALRAGRLDDLDLAHLAEEVEGLAIATRSAVRSRTRIIIEHMLKLQHSPALDPRPGWRRTVRVQRSELHDDLTPTLRRQLEDDLADLYRDGRENAADDLRSHGESTAADTLPSACPYTLDRILSDWLPEAPKA